MQNFEELLKFVDIAIKNRRYPDNTGYAIRAALRLFEKELNKDERESIDKFKINIDQIYQNVFRKNSGELSAKSLATYKSRVTKALSDYEKYGTDPTKMANWPAKVLTRPKKHNTPDLVDKNNAGGSDSYKVSTSDMHKIELSIRPGAPKFIVIVPGDITPDECTRIKAVIDSLSGGKDR